MEQGSVVTSKERVRSLRERVRDPDKIDPCIEDLKDVLEIEAKQLSRAEASCCAGVRLESCLRSGVRILKEALSALQQGDVNQGVSLLEEYEKITQ